MKQKQKVIYKQKNNKWASANQHQDHRSQKKCLKDPHHLFVYCTLVFAFKKIQRTYFKPFVSQFVKQN